MSPFPTLVCGPSPNGEDRYFLVHPLSDRYSEFVAGRVRANAPRAAAFDLKMFFRAIDKDTTEVVVGDVFDFLGHQRMIGVSCVSSTSNASASLGWMPVWEYGNQASSGGNGFPISWCLGWLGVGPQPAIDLPMTREAPFKCVTPAFRVPSSVQLVQDDHQGETPDTSSARILG